MRRGDGGVLRERRADDRLLTDVWLVATGHRPWPCEARRAAGVLRRQGVDIVRGTGADRAVTALLGRAALRSAAGPQPGGLAGPPEDALRDEGGRPTALCRD